jgi:hypothetical protein
MAFRELPKAKWNIKARVYEGAFGRHGTTKDDLPVRAAPKFVSHPTKRTRTVRATTGLRRFVAR